MCGSDLVLDHLYRELWRCYYPQNSEALLSTLEQGPIPTVLIPDREKLEHTMTAFEIEGFRRLFQKATRRRSDQHASDPGTIDTKAKIKQLAASMGIEIDFF